MGRSANGVDWAEEGMQGRRRRKRRKKSFILFCFKIQDSGFKYLGFKIQVSSTLVSRFKFQVPWFQDSRFKYLGFKFQDSGFRGQRPGFKFQDSSFKIQVSSYLFFKPVMGLSFREVMNLLIDLLRLRVSLYSFLAVSLSMKPTSEALII